MANPATAIRHLLVVDDDPLVADSIRRMLQFDGHTVDVAGSAQEAIGLFSSKKFDLALVDYEMPKMKGDELARAIKAMVPNLPVVIFTGFAEMVRSSLGSSQGTVDMVLGKPFNLEELRQTLAAFPPTG